MMTRAVMGRVMDGGGTDGWEFRIVPYAACSE
jgi:hypothetical protein